MNRLIRISSCTALLLGLLILPGCSEVSEPYTDEIAKIDPGLQPIDRPEAPDPKTTPTTIAPNMPDQHPPTPDQPDTSSSSSQDAVTDKVVLTDAQWRAILSDEEYYVLRRSGTERAGTGRYLDNDADEKGAYHCVGCGNKLYDAQHKFHSGCGWPSFNQEVEKSAITEYRDTSFGMLRVEMRCARCDGHLGHIFDDAPGQPTGLRHCVNGTALIFIPQGKDTQDVIREHRAKYAEK